MTAITIVGHRGPSLPLGINRWRETHQQRDPRPLVTWKPKDEPYPEYVPAKADPIWDTAFTTKFSKRPAEDAPMVTPKGALRIIEQFISHTAEIAWLTETQHLELATTRAELAANGIRSDSLTTSRDPDEDLVAQLADMDYHLSRAETRDTILNHFHEFHWVHTPAQIDHLTNSALQAIANLNRTAIQYEPNNTHRANMARRIDFERYLWACGPVHRSRWINNRGALGIAYDGPAKKDEALKIDLARALKQRTIDQFGRLPTPSEIDDFWAFATYYGAPVLASMTQDEIDAWRRSRLYGGNDATGTTEDPDPFRADFHAEDLRGFDDRGYAGVTGSLGFDRNEFYDNPEDYGTDLSTEPLDPDDLD